MAEANLTTQIPADLQARDISDVLNTIRVKMPNILSIIPIIGKAVAHKHEWTEEIIQQKGSTLGGNYVAASGSLIVLDSTVFQIGDHIRIENEALRFRVTAIPDSITLSVTVIHGTDVSITENLVDPQRILFIRPVVEGSDATGGKVSLPGTDFNYTEIFQRDVKISRSMVQEAQQKSIYGLEDAVARGVARKIQELAWEMYNATMFGVRIQRGATLNGAMGGLLFFIDNLSGNVLDAGATLITEIKLNNMIEQIFLSGGDPVNLVMVMNTNQAQKISSLRTDRIRYFNSPEEIGGAVQAYAPDIPGLGPIQIVVDTNFDRDKILFLDKSRISLAPFYPMTQLDTTPPGFDGQRFTIRGEFTLQVANAKEAHGIYKNLAV